MAGMNVFELLRVCDNLKHLKRTGWTKFAIAEPETVACHMYRMAVLAMSLDGQVEGCDAGRCTRMALVHDIAEALVGDITPHCGVSDEDKHDREARAMSQIAAYAPKEVGEEWEKLWREYEANDTLEAKVVKHLDKFDMIAQAFDYEKKYGVDLQQFFDSTTTCFHLEPFVEWNSQLRRQRDEWRKDKDVEKEQEKEKE